MTKIVVTGWKPGFNKVGMTKLLRGSLGYSLSDAKRAVDAILQNRTISLTVAPERLEHLTTALSALGAVFETQN